MLFGIDLGGTKTEITVLDGTQGNCLYKKRTATRRGSYASTLETISGLIKEAEAELNTTVSCFGVAIPGAVSKVTGRIKNANSSWLIGQDLLHDLQRVTGKKAVLENDANCFALSEAFGAGAQYASVWGLILGTGSGTGLVMHRSIVEGRNSLGGEWGHNPLPWMTEYEQKLAAIQPCFCGRQGCIETFVSGTGFEAEYKRQSGQSARGEDIVQRMRAGESAAQETFRLYSDRLARCMACYANFFDPEVIILGGGMSNVTELYEVLPDLIRRYIFGGEFDTPVLRARYGDSSGGRGAALLTASVQDEQA